MTGTKVSSVLRRGPLANLICDVIRKKITGPTLRITVLATRDGTSGVSLATAVHAHSAQDQPRMCEGAMCLVPHNLYQIWQHLL